MLLKEMLHDYCGVLRTTPQTTISKDTIVLNRWSKMNHVSHAKKCFEWKTLCEIADHLYKELGVMTDDGRLKVKDSETGNKVGYMVKVADELKRLLQGQVQSGKMLPERTEAIQHDISSFEWLAHVHEIFHMRLMNMNYQVGEKTINE